MITPSETQQLDFRNHFNTIEDSLSAQQKMFGEFFTRQNSETEKNFDSLQKNFTEKISHVGENVSIVQKNLTKFSSEVDEILSENQNTNEENLPQENFSSNSYSGRKKSISIYGRSQVGKSTLRRCDHKRLSKVCM